MLVFKARVGLFVYFLLLLLIAGLTLYCYYQTFEDALDFLWLLLLFLPASQLVFAFIYTRYRIDGKYFHYHSGYLNGSIPINSIRKISIGKTMYVGTKPALASGGMIIHYNRFDEIYVAPVSNDEMATALQKVNPGIEIIRRRIVKPNGLTD